MTKGWFVDWDGLVRRTESPMDGYRCIVEGTTCEVIKQDGEVVFTATYWDDFEKLEDCLREDDSHVVYR